MLRDIAPACTARGDLLARWVWARPAGRVGALGPFLGEYGSAGRWGHCCAALRFRLWKRSVALAGVLGLRPHRMDLSTQAAWGRWARLGSVRGY